MNFNFKIHLSNLTKFNVYLILNIFLIYCTKKTVKHLSENATVHFGNIKKHKNKFLTKGNAVSFEVTAGGTCGKPCALRN